MIIVNGSRLDSLGYHFGLDDGNGKTTEFANYVDAKIAQLALGGITVFREVWATEWIDTDEDPQY